MSSIKPNRNDANDAAEPLQGLTILYDGECPICQFYISRTEIEDPGINLERINARTAPEHCKAAEDVGLDIDQGIIVTHAGQTYHGSAALNHLAILSKRSGAFNRLTRWLFANAQVSRRIYPLLRGLRNLVLRILGVKPISTKQSPR